jgi:hypothetical protein
MNISPKYRKLKLLCDTNQMAYGSSSALLAILNYLNSYNTAFVWGITEEILSTSNLINRTIKVNNKNCELISKTVNLKEYDAVLVVSNLTNINWYLDFGLPVFYVDLHYWYGTQKNHRIWTEAKKCFVETFLENKVQNENIITVGPIITLTDKKIKTDKLILVNIGGGENRWITPGKNTNYIKIVLYLLNGIYKYFADYKIIIAAGKKTVDILKKCGTKYIFGTYNQEDYLELLNRAEILITSPGLNAVFEGLYYHKKIIFLPPQNASQIIQLQYYEKSSLVGKGMNLTKYFNEFHSLESKYLDEKKLTDEVLSALDMLEQNNSIKRKLIDHLAKQIVEISKPEYKNIINKVIDILGTPGAKTIAETITETFA